MFNLLTRKTYGSLGGNWKCWRDSNKEGKGNDNFHGKWLNVNWCIRDWGCGVLYESITSFRFFIIKGQLFASQKRRICKTLDLQRAWILKSRITFLALYETDIIDSIAKAVFLLFLLLYRNSQKIEGRSDISNGCSILKNGTNKSYTIIHSHTLAT